MDAMDELHGINALCRMTGLPHGSVPNLLARGGFGSDQKGPLRCSVRVLLELGALDEPRPIVPWTPPWSFRVATNNEKCINGCRIVKLTECVDGVAWDILSQSTQPLCHRCYRSFIKQQQCHYCGSEGRTHDHLTPPSRGGSDVPSNWAPACHPCNVSKRNRTFEEFSLYIENRIFAIRKTRAAYGLGGAAFDGLQYRLAV